MTVKALDDRHDLLVRGGFESTEGTRDRYAYDRQDMLADSLEAWRVNPLARRIVALTSQYVVGAGIEVTSRHEGTSAFLHEWQEHRLNRLQTRAFEWCDELTRTGNLFLVATTDAAGMTYFRAVPAFDVDEIETQPNDVEQPVRFLLKPTLDGKEPVSYTAYDQETDAQNEDGSYPAVMLHYAINRPVGAKWGESDLAPLLTWLTRYAAWLQDRARLNKYRQAFMYIVQGNYASAADRLQRQAEVNANPPGNGSILVTDTSEIWGILNPQLDSADANTDGLALKKMIAAGAGVPLHFLAEPESSTRTTAEAAGGPTFRHYQQRQVFFLWILRDLARLVIRRRAMVDRHISVKADLEAQAPDISGRDNAALAVAATQVANAFAQLHDRGLIPDDELVRLIYTFAGETVDVDDILARAPRTPQTPQYAPVGEQHAAPAGESGGRGKPEKPAKPGLGAGQPTEAKPYNQNDDGDVSAKGAQMASDSAAEIVALRAWLAERLAESNTPSPASAGEGGGRGTPPPTMPNMIFNLPDTLTEKYQAGLNALTANDEATRAQLQRLADQVEGLAQSLLEEEVITVNVPPLDLTPIAQAIAALADRPAPIVTVPAPVVNVTTPQPIVNLSTPPQPAPVIMVETPRRTKTIHRDEDGQIEAITEE